MKLNKHPSTKIQNTLEVFQLPVLQDNYIYILRDENTQKTAVVDPALSEPVNLFLEEKNWELDFIFNTHHHWDHTDGNIKLKKKWNCPIFGFIKDAHRIPGIDIHLQEGEEFTFGKFPCHILFLPGHTLGHIAYWFFKEKKLFIGDTLFAMGCGRLFEGSPQQMWASLNQIKPLPPETEIFCAHEYTEKNGHFALNVDPQNQSLKNRMKKVITNRKKNKPTVPFFLSEELNTNPFLRANTLEEFTQLRNKRDLF